MADMRVISFSYDMTEDTVKMWCNKDFEHLHTITQANVLEDILSYMGKVRDLYNQAVEEIDND